MYKIMGMTKVHPNAVATTTTTTPLVAPVKTSSLRREEVLTVWRKSLLLNCNGFTVFDCKGNLVFRVDNYLSGSKAEIVLMDAAGKPLVTIRRKRLSLMDGWQVFDGESRGSPRFTARRHTNILNTKCLAQVSRGNGGSAYNSGNESPSSPSSSSKKSNVVYEIEGSYAQRNCAIYDDRRSLVAEIKRKEAVGNDVFRLVVQPEMDMTVAMSIVILVDQMVGSSFSELKYTWKNRKA